MLPYTGGKPQKRHAALALNLQGGGGFEIWQYVERTPLSANFEIKLGDIGIYCRQNQMPQRQIYHDFLKSRGVEMLSGICVILVAKNISL